MTSFGSALLRGMGWSEGAAIGKTNKGICEPIEYIPRHKGKSHVVKAVEGCRRNNQSTAKQLKISYD